MRKNESDYLINKFDVWTNEENIKKLKGLWDVIKEALMFGFYKKRCWKINTSGSIVLQQWELLATKLFFIF